MLAVLADLEEVQAERVDVGQHAVQCRPVQDPGEHGVPTIRCATRAGNAINIVAPRCPSIRNVYRAGPRSMPPMVEGRQVTRLHLCQVTAGLPRAGRRQ